MRFFRLFRPRILYVFWIKCGRFVTRFTHERRTFCFDFSHWRSLSIRREAAPKAWRNTRANFRFFTVTNCRGQFTMTTVWQLRDSFRMWNSGTREQILGFDRSDLSKSSSSQLSRLLSRTSRFMRKTDCTFLVTNAYRVIHPREFDVARFKRDSRTSSLIQNWLTIYNYNKTEKTV